MGRLRRLCRTDFAGSSACRTCRAVRPEREAAPHRPMNRPPDFTGSPGRGGPARPGRECSHRGEASRDDCWPTSAGATERRHRRGTSPAQGLPGIGYPMMGREELAGGPAAVLSLADGSDRGEVAMDGGERNVSDRIGPDLLRSGAGLRTPEGSPPVLLGAGLPTPPSARPKVSRSSKTNGTKSPPPPRCASRGHPKGRRRRPDRRSPGRVGSDRTGRGDLRSSRRGRQRRRSERKSPTGSGAVLSRQTFGRASGRGRRPAPNTRADRTTGRPTDPARTERRRPYHARAIGALAVWRSSARSPVNRPRPPVPARTTPGATEFFEKSIRPMLAEKCQKCHGGDKTRGGLSLASRELGAQGGRQRTGGRAGQAAREPDHRGRRAARRAEDAARGEALPGRGRPPEALDRARPALARGASG